MKTQSSIIRQSVSFLSLCIATSIQGAERPAVTRVTIPQGSDAGVVWHKRSSDGAELGVANELRTPPSSLKQENRLAKTLKGNIEYYTAMPGGQRSGHAIVTIRIHATASPSSELGTVIDVDGAVFGFHPSAGSPRAEIVTLDTASNGVKKWMRTGFSVAIDPKTNLTRATGICVKVDYANKAWALYCDDMAIDEFLPLGAQKAVPTVSIQTKTANASAILDDFAFVGSLPRRPEQLVASHNGSVNLAAAFAEGNPSVKKNAKPPKK